MALVGSACVLTGPEAEPGSLWHGGWVGMAAGPGSLDKPRCGSSTHLLKGKVGRTESRVETCEGFGDFLNRCSHQSPLFKFCLTCTINIFTVSRKHMEVTGENVAWYYPIWCLYKSTKDTTGLAHIFQICAFFNYKLQELFWNTTIQVLRFNSHSIRYSF